MGKETRRETDSEIGSALRRLSERVEAATARSGRSPGAVRILAVTKTVSVERIDAAVAAGQRLFGENRVQEAAGKIGRLEGKLTWHMIGNLQKNKVNRAVELFDAIESVDSRELAERIDRRAREMHKVMTVYLQVKEADEATKSGVAPAEAPRLIESVCKMANLDLRGLMTIPPWPEKPEDSRPYFAGLRRLRDAWDGRYCDGGTLRELSMGMTADFEPAVEEGATIVRVGSAIFGVR